MPFSAYHWAVVIVLDVLLRAAPLIIPIYMLLAISLSFIHLCTLMSISAYVRTFELPTRAAVRITLLWTNIVFVIVFVTAWVGFIWNGRVSGCAYDRCDWINGVITWHGVQTIALVTLMQIGTNLLPIAIVFPFRKRRTDGAAA